MKRQNLSIRRASLFAAARARRLWIKFLAGASGRCLAAREAICGITPRILSGLGSRGVPGFLGWGQKAPGSNAVDGRLAVSVCQPESLRSFVRRLAPADAAKHCPIRPRLCKSAPARFRKVLVVGGMDFLGSALVRQLNAIGFTNITVTDSLSEVLCGRLPALKFREFISRGDFEKMAASGAVALAEYSHTFYLGGWEESSMGLTKTLLASALEKGTRLIAFAPASSMGPMQGCPDEERSDPENFRPLTRAGLVSCLFDRYASARSFRRNFLSLKYHQLFGFGEKEGEGIGGLVKSCHRQIHECGVIHLPSQLRPEAPEGRRKYDFLAVGEAARIAVFLAQRQCAAGVYELGSGEASTPGKLVQAAADAIGCKNGVRWDGGLPFDPPDPQPECAETGRLAMAGWIVHRPDLKAAVLSYITGCLDRAIARGREMQEPEETSQKPSWNFGIPPRLGNSNSRLLARGMTPAFGGAAAA